MTRFRVRGKALSAVHTFAPLLGPGPQGAAREAHPPGQHLQQKSSPPQEAPWHQREGSDLRPNSQGRRLPHPGKEGNRRQEGKEVAELRWKPHVSDSESNGHPPAAAHLGRLAGGSRRPRDRSWVSPTLLPSLVLWLWMRCSLSVTLVSPAGAEPVLGQAPALLPLPRVNTSASRTSSGLRTRLSRPPRCLGAVAFAAVPPRKRGGRVLPGGHLRLLRPPGRASFHSPALGRCGRPWGKSRSLASGAVASGSGSPVVAVFFFGGAGMLGEGAASALWASGAVFSSSDVLALALRVISKERSSVYWWI